MLPKLLLAAFLQFLLVGCTVLTRTPISSDDPGQFQKPRATKVVLVVLENKHPEQARSEKFLGSLAASGAYFSNYYAIAHPSQPNYVALVSGSTEGVTADFPARLERAHLGQKLQSWMTYAEGYPSGTCDLRETIKTNAHAYARKHVPFLSFADVQDNKDFCRDHIVGFDKFLSAAKDHSLPGFSLVIPDLNHDAHDGSLSEADAWLEKNFRDLINDAEFRRDVLLIVTFDENEVKWPYFGDNDNRVFTVLWGDDVVPGEVKTVYNHYDLLRTIEAIFDLPAMSTEDAKARPIGGIWRQWR